MLKRLLICLFLRSIRHGPVITGVRSRGSTDGPRLPEAAHRRRRCVSPVSSSQTFQPSLTLFLHASHPSAVEQAHNALADELVIHTGGRSYLPLQKRQRCLLAYFLSFFLSTFLLVLSCCYVYLSACLHVLSTRPFILFTCFLAVAVFRSTSPLLLVCLPVYLSVCLSVWSIRPSICFSLCPTPHSLFSLFFKARRT